jgi:multiple sugar transport system ATP-binding protein
MKFAKRRAVKEEPKQRKVLDHMAGVLLRNVVKRYGAFEAVKGIDLEIGGSEFVALVGPSGCGKSTTLRMIAGLEDISDGEIVIGNRVVNDLAPKERDIAMVFQNYALYPHMTIRENMAFALKQKKTEKAEIKRRVDRAADILGLQPLLDRYPKQLSGGQRQRVAMGRAIVRDPKVFLFDEPLSNLDAKLRVQMRTEIKELHQRLKTTTVYVTHDQIEAMTLADKIVVMRDGIIEQAGAPLELYDQPTNRFVAEFIGSPSMNIFEGGMEAEGFRTKDGVLFPSPVRPDYIGRSVLYGIRPEHIDLGGEGEGVAATVHVVEPTGAEILLICRAGSTNITVVTRNRMVTRPGTILYLAPSMENIHLFNPETGLRL